MVNDATIALLRKAARAAAPDRAWLAERAASAAESLRPRLHLPSPDAEVPRLPDAVRDWILAQAPASEVSNGLLDDCFNGRALLAKLGSGQLKAAAVLKVPVPMGGFEAFALGNQTLASVRAAVASIQAHLFEHEMDIRLVAFRSFMADSDFPGVPNRILDRIEFLLPPDALVELLILLPEGGIQSLLKPDDAEPTAAPEPSRVPRRRSSPA